MKFFFSKRRVEQRNPSPVESFEVSLDSFEEEKLSRLKATNQAILQSYRPSNWLTHVSNFWIGISLWKRLLLGVVIFGAVIASGVFFHIPLLVGVGAGVALACMGVNLTLSAHYDEIDFSKKYIGDKLGTQTEHLKISLDYSVKQRQRLKEQEEKNQKQLKEQEEKNQKRLEEQEKKLKDTQDDLKKCEQGYEAKLMLLSLDCKAFGDENSALRASIQSLTETIGTLNGIKNTNAELTTTVTAFQEHLSQTQLDHQNNQKRLQNIFDKLEHANQDHTQNNQNFASLLAQVKRQYIDTGPSQLVGCSIFPSTVPDSSAVTSVHQVLVQA